MPSLSEWGSRMVFGARRQLAPVAGVDSSLMTGLPPIPVPSRVVWQSFREQLLPAIVFVIVATVAAILWLSHNVGASLMGVAEGPRALVSSPQPGTLAAVLVHPFQIVSAGTPLAIIEPFDLRTRLGVLQTELDLARLRLQPTLAEQNALDFERLRADLLQTKSELSIAEASLARAEREVRRNTPLVEEQLVSADAYEVVLKSRDMDLAEVMAKSNTVAEIQNRLQELQRLGKPEAMTNDPAALVLARLDRLQRTLATNLGPITLVAPISGMIGSFLRQPGENVVEGEPLLAIGAVNAERIVGYLRQPYPFDPTVGQPVLVRTREISRRQFQSAVAQVGAQVEIVTNALARVRPETLVDVALPVVVTVPPGIYLRPGEVVDLQLQKGTQPPTAATQLGERADVGENRSLSIQ